MMGISGFNTKKELKAAVGSIPRFIETSIFGNEFKGDGSYTVVGPDPYIRKKWYATVTITDGLINKVT
jgi:hypothetical protein